MQCDICFRPSNGRLPFNCTSCVRNALYEPRIQHAQVLLQREAAGKDIERIMTISHPARLPDASTSPSNLQGANAPTRVAVDRTLASITEAMERTQATFDHVEALQRQIKDMKTDIMKRKLNQSKRRSDLESVTRDLSQRRAIAIDPTEKSIKRTEHRWDAMHIKTAESRNFLCREAAHLYGLEQRKRRKGVPGRETYLIAGVAIADLRDLNNASPAQVTTSTTSLAHLVHLVSHYLSLRLPAEITLPHCDYPLPTIFSPGSSYASREFPFPRSTPSQSSNNSPSGSHTGDLRPPPRPRPLYLDKKLPALAKDDPIAYALFVEGVTLLAWDIAWVCKTQGLNVGGNSWDEVCAMGKNLWQLLVAPPTTARSPHKDLSKFPSPLRTLVAANTTAREESGIEGSLGHFSHGTAHSFLAAAEGTEYMRAWRLQSPVKVIEKVKTILSNERTGAEWEILEGNEWEEDPAPVSAKAEQDTKREEEEAVIVKASRRSDSGFDDTRSIISAMTAGDEVDVSVEKGRGTSGWTKLKSRGG